MEAPSGKAIAYRATDFALGSPAYIYGSGVKWPHPYPAHQSQSGTRGDAIQWSLDSTRLRTELRFGPELHLWGWQAFTVDRFDLEEEEAADIEWADPVEPAELPAFIAQRAPVISRDMPIVWGGDSKAVYVGDDEGVWRATLGEYFMPVWELIHMASHVQALALAPSGEYLVVESGVAEERSIDELHLAADGVTARSVGTGWGVAFGPMEDIYHFANYRAIYAAHVGEEPMYVKGAAMMPVGW